MRYYLVLMLAMTALTFGISLESKPLAKTSLASSGQQIDEMGNQFAEFIETIFSTERAKMAFKVESKNTTSGKSVK